MPKTDQKRPISLIFSTKKLQTVEISCFFSNFCSKKFSKFTENDWKFSKILEKLNFSSLNTQKFSFSLKIIEKIAEND